MIKLGVNIDHVATLREARRGLEPELVPAALAVLAAGADSIVAHLREDRRHIQDKDVFLIKAAVEKKLNLEMSIAPEIVDIACELKPGQATLVPEKRRELTTEGGLDVAGHFKNIRACIKKLSGKGIGVSLFIDPDKKQIDAAKESGVEMIELHTGRYADAEKLEGEARYLTELKNAAVYAAKRGLHVFAGHGLDYYNVSRVAAIPEIEELNIGYSIICRSVMVGLGQAVKEMLTLIRNNEITK